MEKQEGFQFHPKKYVADNIVQAMDWDARGMYMHLLCMAYQENPQGSIPNDDAVIRRWLNLAHGSEENLRVWRRVRPQIIAAFQLRDGRWFQKGLCTTLERQRRKSDSSTNNVRKRYENTNTNSLFVSSSKEKPSSLEEVIQFCKEIKSPIDARKFFDYYKANGWKVGRGNPMKDWRAAVRYWERNLDGTDRQATPDLSPEANPECFTCKGTGYRASYSTPGKREPCECTQMASGWRNRTVGEDDPVGADEFEEAWFEEPKEVPARSLGASVNGRGAGKV